tara:strand:- start:98 stop:739 length:642 start_codon:yes stop_codon:yes gene_type:complete
MAFVPHAQQIKEILMTNRLFIIILSILITMAPIQGAQNVHTHGTGQWHIMSTEDRLVMTMKLPAMSIIGFEHKASTNKEKEIIDAAKKILQDPSLFTFYSTSRITKKSNPIPLITPSNQSVSMVVESAKTEAKDDAHDDDHHHHDDHDDHDAHNETHAEFHATFEYKKIDRISSISTTLFDHFNGIEKIEASIITDQKQSSAILTKDNPRIRL